MSRTAFIVTTVVALTAAALAETPAEDNSAASLVLAPIHESITIRDAA